MFRMKTASLLLAASLALLASGCASDGRSNEELAEERLDEPLEPSRGVGAAATAALEGEPEARPAMDSAGAAGTDQAKAMNASAGVDAPEVATVGKPAPDFALTDLEGKPVKLSDHRGKVVVLEWFNPECPFVVRHHEKDTLRTAAADSAKDGVVWLAINSGAPGKQGTGKEKNAKFAKEWAMAHPVLLDEKGEVGKRYDAKTTPHMYVIDAKGVLVYAGGVDDDPRGSKSPEERKNHLMDALSAVKAGRKPETASSKPYGCSVKYAD